MHAVRASRTASDDHVLQRCAIFQQEDGDLDRGAAGGHGLSEAFGLAGFTNLDVVRNPSLGSAPYLARVMVRKIIRLAPDDVDAARTPLSFSPKLPSRRLEVRAGKLGMVDFFDLNAVGSDSHLQFTNWTIDNNGAYDYAADTRGYTWAAIVEYASRLWSVRFAEALMPTVANGITFDWNLSRSRGENLELELHPTPALAVRLGLAVDKGYIQVNSELETNLPGVFAGGDCIRAKNAASTVMAVQDGKLAAAAIDRRIAEKAGA